MLPSLPAHTNIDSEQFAGKLFSLIKIRWIAFLLTIFAIGVGYFLDQLEILRFDIMPLVLTGATIGVFNLIFHLTYVHLTLPTSESESQAFLNKFICKHRLHLFSQVIVDFIGVTILAILYGISTFPFEMLFLPHIIIVSIVCYSKRVDLLVLLIALAMMYFIIGFHYDEISMRSQEIFRRPDIINGAFILAVFNTAIFFSVYFLTNLLVDSIQESRNKLIHTNQKLVDVDQEKQRYTLRATHELKAPFAAIQSYIQVMLGGYLGKLDPKIEDIMQKMDKRCTLLSLMIQNIIQLSNLKTFRLEKKSFEKQNILSFVKEITDSFTSTAKKKNIGLKFTSNIDQSETFLIIPQLFRILLNNLILNAIRYSSSDSEVEISVFKLHSDSIEFSIRDHGIGIPNENLSKIFNDHFRCNNAVKHCDEGNGMGLSIVREIVRLHSGDIEVKSELGEGTTFIVTLPAFNPLI